MAKVLFLAHRIPFPPNKGDKIRSYHLLCHLARRHQVFLASFVDDPNDWQHRTQVESLCAEVCLRPLNVRRAKVRSALGLVTGQPMSLPYYYDAELQRWVDATMSRERIDHVIVYSAAVAQFVDHERYADRRRIVDLVDVDSDKWRQYAARRRGLMSWIYAREASKLLAYERGLAGRFDAAVFVTAAEAALFRGLAPEVAERVDYYDNGVDAEYFDPSLEFESPYPPGGPVVVFTGAMDYWANVEAVGWFGAEVLPHIQRARPDVRFFIVGSNPTDAVRALARRQGVTVTGRVPDVRPFIRHAALAVAPLRIARGTQNKVLEALAMERAVVCTPAAAEGLHREEWLAAWTHQAPGAFAGTVLEHLDGKPFPEGREYVARHYRWDRNLSRIEHLLALS